MKIIGLEGLSEEALNEELKNGAKLVCYEYCISILIMTFKRSSDVHFIKSGENAFVKGLGYTLISLLFGWWGFPFGPIYTIGALICNCGGGKNVTSLILADSANQSEQ